MGAEAVSVVISVRLNKDRRLRPSFHREPVSIVIRIDWVNPVGVPLVLLLETLLEALLPPDDPNLVKDPMSEVRLSTGALRRSHFLALGSP